MENYTSTGEWYEDIKKRGYTAPLAMCHGLDKLMKAKNLTFPEAFKFLSDNKKIILAGKRYVYDLSASKLWDKTK